MTQPEKKSRTPRDPKQVAQDAVDVIDRKIEREKKHLSQAQSVVVGAQQALQRLQVDREYAASHPLLREPQSEPETPPADDPFA